jgi:hypothetical protein
MNFMQLLIVNVELIEVGSVLHIAITVSYGDTNILGCFIHKFELDIRNIPAATQTCSCGVVKD